MFILLFKVDCFLPKFINVEIIRAGDKPAIPSINP